MQDCSYFDVSSRSKIEVTGKDAVVFLHNLSTNDIKSLPVDRGCEVFFCTATAKVVAFGRAWRLAAEGKRDRLWLDADPGLGEKLYQHLDRYLISEDVTLTDHTSSLAQWHVWGPRATEVIPGAKVWDRLTIQELGPWTVRHVDPLGVPGYDVVGPAGEIAALVKQIAEAGGRQATAEEYEALRIEAGTPVYGVDLHETTFAPEVGRTAQAISYQKGCYLGQEPIVMARDRGMVQRALVGLRLGDELAPAGSLLYRDGKEIGRLTSCTRSGKWGAIGLGYVRRANQTAGTTLEVEANGTRRAVTVAALPFA